MQQRFLALCLTTICLSLNSAIAAQAASCPAPTDAFWVAQGNDGLVVLEADYAEWQPREPSMNATALTNQDANGIGVLRGDVVVLYEKAKLEASEASVSGPDIQLSGPISIKTERLSATGDRAQYNLNTQDIQVEAASYNMASGARGSANNIAVKGEQTELDTVEYSFCPPEQRTWSLVAGEISLNEETGQGYAEDVTVHIGGVPVFWLPYFRFPYAFERKSGFLVPSVTIKSDDGLDLIVPYYWNIAPNLDLTIGPRIIQERGFGIESEFRYLTPSSEGEIYLSGLVHDRRTGSARSFARWQHYSNLDNGWTARADVQTISDREFLEDIDTDFDRGARDFLSSTAHVRYQDANIFFQTSLQQLSVLNTSSIKPFTRLPEVELRMRDQLAFNSPFETLEYGFNSEITWFDHDTREHGARVHVNPYIQWRWDEPSGFASAEVGARALHYQLTSPTTADRDLSAAAGYINTSAGLRFVRNLDFDGVSLQQNLEPSLGLVYVSDVDQNDFPTFDTSTPTLTLNRLFDTERNSGVDRITDEQRLNAQIWTRFNNDQRETFALGIGEQWRFDDTEQTLDGSTIDDNAGMVGSIRVSPMQNFTMRGDFNLNRDDHSVDRIALHTDFRSDNNDTILHVAYFARQSNESRTTDISLRAPMTSSISYLGRWRQDWENEELMELITGFEYNDCCSAIRLLGRRRRDDQNQLESQLLLQFELKGLSTVGHRIDNLLDHGILAPQ